MDESNKSLRTLIPAEGAYNQQPYSPASRVLILLVVGIIIVVTIVGNIFVIVAYIRDPKIRARVGNLLIFNLALTDLLIGVFSLTFNLSWLTRGYWPHGEIICKLWLVLDYTVCWVSMITMVLISWDRYCLVSMGLKYKTYQTNKRVGIILAIVWTIVTILLSLVAFAWGPITGVHNVDYDRVCVMEFILLPYAPLIVNLIPFGVLVVSIVTLNANVYVNIYRRSRDGPQIPPKPDMKLRTGIHHPTLNDCASLSTYCDGVALSPEEHGDHDVMKARVESARTQLAECASGIIEPVVDVEKVRRMVARHQKAATVLSILTGCFILFWMPYIITTVIYSLCTSDCVPDAIWEFTEVLAWCNSTINPFIYAATNLQFRKNFRRYLLLDLWMCKRRH